MKVEASVCPADKKLVEEYVKRCMRLLRKKEYELDLPTDCWKKAVEVLSVGNRHSRSKAGAHIIRINLGGSGFYKTFSEYKAFADHPTIGSIAVNSAEDFIKVLVAHEVSHHVQYRYAWRIKRFKKTYRKPHGECFRAIYGYLRRDLVNPEIKGEGA